MSPKVPSIRRHAGSDNDEMSRAALVIFGPVAFALACVATGGVWLRFGELPFLLRVLAALGGLVVVLVVALVGLVGPYWGRDDG